ncbi:hypothetical protein [Leptospira noguchii]|uniref:hypothetical protein n=1 Tax=Leptospira noguchii TaxID=28182 RepID=UPI001E2CC666|nr:hypothetical protein [Leptospira noguchii]
MKELADCEEILEILKQGENGEHVEDILAEYDLSYEEAQSFFSRKIEEITKRIDESGLGQKIEERKKILQAIRNFKWYEIKTVKDVDEYIFHLKNIHQFKDDPEFLYELFYLFHNHINQIYDSKQSICRGLLQLYSNTLRSYVPTLEKPLHLNLEQAIANVSVKLAIKTRIKEDEKLALQLIPSRITVDSLAFNLTKLYALKQDRPNMIKYLETTLSLLDTSYLLEDSVLSQYKKEILTIAKSKRK